MTFTIAPIAGAGATFGASAGCTLGNGNLTAVCTISGGKATSPPLTANDTGGAFNVTAAATGAPTQTIHLTNIAITLVVNSAADGYAEFHPLCDGKCEHLPPAGRDRGGDTEQAHDHLHRYRLPGEYTDDDHPDGEHVCARYDRDGGRHGAHSRCERRLHGLRHRRHTRRAGCG